MVHVYTICETPLFTKLAPDYWTDDEYNGFKFFSMNPECENVEPGTNGIRKIRWSTDHRESVAVFELFTITDWKMVKYGYLPFMEKVQLINYQNRF